MTRKCLLEPLVGADHFGQGLRRLRLVRDQRVGIHRGDHLRIAGEVLVLETQHVRVRRHVAQPLEHRQRKVRSGQSERETLADQAGELSLVLEGVEAGHDSAGAVAEQEYGKARLTGFRELHECGHVGDVISELLHIKALAIRLAAAAEVNRGDSVAIGRKLSRSPRVVPTVRIEAGYDGHHRARLASGQPRSKDDLQSIGRRETVFGHGHYLIGHGILLVTGVLCGDPAPHVPRAIDDSNPVALDACEKSSPPRDQQS